MNRLKRQSRKRCRRELARRDEFARVLLAAQAAMISPRSRGSASRTPSRMLPTENASTKARVAQNGGPQALHRGMHVRRGTD